MYIYYFITLFKYGFNYNKMNIKKIISTNMFERVSML